MPNPVAYAEKNLGVHSVYAEANERLEAHIEIGSEVARLRVAIRNVGHELADREADITTEQRAKYHEMSENAFGPVVRREIHADKEHTALRLKERDLRNDLDMAELQLSHVEKALGSVTARMHELGGLLNFYAARTGAAPQSHEANEANNTGEANK